MYTDTTAPGGTCCEVVSQGASLRPCFASKNALFRRICLFCVSFSYSSLRGLGLCAKFQFNQSLTLPTSIKDYLDVFAILSPLFQCLVHSSPHMFLAADSHKASSAIMEDRDCAARVCCRQPQRGSEKVSWPFFFVR